MSPSVAGALYLYVGILPPTADYTDRDLDALRARLIALLESVFSDWSDFEVATFGNVLLEMFAFVGDVLGFYGDNHARESKLVTATQRKSVIALAQMFGYRLGGARAAVADVELRLDAVPRAEVRIPAGTTVRTEEVTELTRFQLLEDALIAAASDPPVAMVRAEHSQSHERAYDVFGRGELDQELWRKPYLDGSAEVSASNGDYVEMPSLLGSGPTDRHFVVRVDQNDRATLRFGDGTHGAAPTGTLRVRYKTGGGLVGRVDAGRLRVLEGTFTDTSGRPVRVHVTNPFRTEGGFDREAIAAAQVNIPESLRALTRSVAREDFEIHARQVPGVARADAHEQRGHDDRGERGHPLHRPGRRWGADPGAEERSSPAGHRGLPEHADVPGLGAGRRLPAHRIAHAPVLRAGGALHGGACARGRRSPPART